MAENLADRAQARNGYDGATRDALRAAASTDRTGQYVRGDRPGGRAPAQL
jgi:hypothetical protein